MRETDLQVLRGSQPAHTNVHKVQTQGAIYYKDDFKASRALVSTPTQDAKPFNKAKKVKKKKQHKDKRDSRDSTISATGNNAEFSGNGKRRRKKKDVRKITYYNCNKLGQYAD